MIIFTILRGIVKMLFRALRTAVLILYRLCKLLHIRLLVLYLMICGICQLCFRTFSGAALPFFWIGLVACCALTLFGWFHRQREHSRRTKPERQPKRDSVREREKEVKKTDDAPKRREVEQKPLPTYPQYFEVAGHAGYMFAEYADRYELFCRDEKGWQYVKTDYKKERF